MQSWGLKKIEPIIPILLCGFLILFDFLFYLRGKFPTAIRAPREFFVILVVISFIPLIKRIRFVESRDVLVKLRGISFAVVALYLVYFIPKAIFGPGHDSPLFSSFGTFGFGLIVSLVTAIVLIAALLMIRELILFKRKKYSSRNFNLFSLILGIHLVVVLMDRGTFGFRLESLGMANAEDVSLFVLIVLMVVNSFRNSWVNYLDKPQKLKSLLWGVPVIIGAIFLEIIYTSNDIFPEYSVLLSGFINQGGLFLCIYLGMSFLSLLLHLPTAGIFDQKMGEIESLHELGKTVLFEVDSERLVNLITGKAKGLIKSDALWLELLAENGTELRIVAADHLSKQEMNELNLDPSSGIEGWIIQNRQSFLINQLHLDPRADNFKNWSKKIGSLLAVPLMAPNRLLGILFVGKEEEFFYDEDDRDLLQTFANQATILLENARMVTELIGKERLEQELKIAHDAQRKLLPKAMPKLQGLDIDAVSITANEVGGDYYDFFPTQNGLAIVIGDVSGKGAQAAFYMAELKGVIESLSKIYASPKALLGKANEILYNNLDKQAFISLIYAIIDINNKELTFTRAGHCPLLYCSNGLKESEFIEPSGLALGLENGEVFDSMLSEYKMELKKGDVFVFYTDGVTEAKNKARIEFDEERLKDVVSRYSNVSAAEIKEQLTNEIRNFIGLERTDDDLTFVVTKVL